MSVLTWAFPILTHLFPRTFPDYQTEVLEELCEVKHVLSFQLGDDPFSEKPPAPMKYFTLEDRSGARGVLSTGSLSYDDPMTKIVAGDKLLVQFQRNKHFPLEMRILKAKEIYARDKLEPIVLAAA